VTLVIVLHEKSDRWMFVTSNGCIQVKNTFGLSAFISGEGELILFCAIVCCMLSGESCASI
jgi:hypothetical protein